MPEAVLFEVALAALDVLDDDLARHRSSVPEVTAHQRVVPEPV
jgi:hypothetical protein